MTPEERKARDVQLEVLLRDYAELKTLRNKREKIEKRIVVLEQKLDGAVR